MNIKRTLSTLVTIASTLFAVGARAYQLTLDEPADQRQLGNALLGATIERAARAIHDADNMVSVLSAVIPAGACILHAYAQSSSPASPSLRNTALQVPVVRLANSSPVVVSIENNLEDRLRKVGFNVDDLPEEFLDPISFEVMKDPVIAVTSVHNRGQEQRTEHIYDRSTFNKLNGICPENRQPFIEVRSAVALKHKMKEFVKQKEQVFLANRASNGGRSRVAIRG